MEDFPSEIIEKILSYLDNIDYRNCLIASPIFNVERNSRILQRVYKNKITPNDCVKKDYVNIFLLLIKNGFQPNYETYYIADKLDKHFYLDFIKLLKIPLVNPKMFWKYLFTENQIIHHASRYFLYPIISSCDDEKYTHILGATSYLLSRHRPYYSLGLVKTPMYGKTSKLDYFNGEILSGFSFNDNQINVINNIKIYINDEVKIINREEIIKNTYQCKHYHYHNYLNKLLTHPNKINVFFVDVINLYRNNIKIEFDYFLPTYFKYINFLYGYIDIPARHFL